VVVCRRRAAGRHRAGGRGGRGGADLVVAELVVLALVELWWALVVAGR
jgi:hypothetical protein